MSQEGLGGKPLGVHAGTESSQQELQSHWGCRGAHPGHVGVPGGDQVVGHLVHGAGEVLQRLGPHQPVRKVQDVQDGRHCCRKDAIVVGHALHEEGRGVSDSTARATKIAINPHSDTLCMSLLDSQTAVGCGCSPVRLYTDSLP